MKKVYIIEFKDRYKVGVSKDPSKRLIQLNAGSVDAKLIYESKYVSNAYEIESMAHNLLSKYSIGREWFFGISKQNVIDTVDNCVNLIGYTDEDLYNQRVPDLKIYYKEEHMPITEAICKVHKETEEMKKENDAILDLLTMIASNNSFSGIIKYLINCNWSYIEIRDFIKTLQ